MATRLLPAAIPATALASALPPALAPALAPALITARGTVRSTGRPALRLAGEVALTLGRAHEICGGARRSLAAMLAGAATGPVVWIQPAWQVERINGEALAGLADPGRFLFVHPRRPEEPLWCMEEVLRSGAAPLAICDLEAPPGLTPVRRLHLAAEAGAGGAARHPLGLILTPGAGGAAGIESRWRMEAAHGTVPGWHLARLRARGVPPQDWRLRRTAAGLALEAA